MTSYRFRFAASLIVFGASLPACAGWLLGTDDNSAGSSPAADAGSNVVVPTQTEGGLKCELGYTLEGSTCVKDLPVAEGALAVRVDQARITGSEPLQLSVRVSNGEDADALALSASTLSVTGSDGLSHDAREITVGTVWVEGAAGGGKVAAGAGFNWRVQVPDLTLSSGVRPVELQIKSHDGRSAKVAVALEACTPCGGAVCTYLDRDVAHCGACGRGPDGAQAMTCKSGTLLCDDAAATLCPQGASKFACANTQTSTTHCGSCGTPVISGGVCVSGTPACANGAAPSGGKCPSWKRVSNPTGQSVQSLWGSSATDVWAGGGRGSVAHWDGSAWTQRFDIAGEQDVNAIWGSSASNVWYVAGSVGALYHPSTTALPIGVGTNPALYGIWGTASNNVWISGAAGYMARYNGGTWTPTATRSSATLLNVWGTAANDVWAVGTGGTSMHFNGNNWSTVPTGITRGLRGLWGSSVNDIWTCGGGGNIGHWNGTAWSVVPSGTTADLAWLWGAAANDVWAVGTGGTILHWNGTLLSPVPSGTTQTITTIWGSGANDIWAGAESAQMLRFGY